MMENQMENAIGMRRPVSDPSTNRECDDMAMRAAGQRQSKKQLKDCPMNCKKQRRRIHRDEVNEGKHCTVRLWA
jgi:hypothetical protein